MDTNTYGYYIGLFLLFLAIIMLIVGIIWIYRSNPTLSTINTTTLLSNNLMTSNQVHWGWWLIILGVIFLIIGIVLMYSYSSSTPVIPISPAVIPASPPVIASSPNTHVTIDHPISSKHSGDVTVSTSHDHIAAQRGGYYSAPPVHPMYTYSSPSYSTPPPQSVSYLPPSTQTIIDGPPITREVIVRHIETPVYRHEVITTPAVAPPTVTSTVATPHTYISSVGPVSSSPPRTKTIQLTKS